MSSSSFLCKATILRDLKPENLLYSSCDDEARLLISDFGLASSEPLMTETCGLFELNAFL